MIQVRQNTFETNSSSTHSIVICSKETFDKWKAGLLAFDVDTEEFIDPFTKEVEEDLIVQAVDQYKNVYMKNDPYKIPWDDLSDILKQKHIDTYVTLHKDDILMEKGLTYDYYRNYYKQGCEYSEKYHTTEHGDTVVSFGKGGYDG